MIPAAPPIVNGQFADLGPALAAEIFATPALQWTGANGPGWRFYPPYDQVMEYESGPMRVTSPGSIEWKDSTREWYVSYDHTGKYLSQGDGDNSLTWGDALAFAALVAGTYYGLGALGGGDTLAASAGSMEAADAVYAGATTTGGDLLGLEAASVAGGVSEAVLTPPAVSMPDPSMFYQPIPAVEIASGAVSAAGAVSPLLQATRDVIGVALPVAQAVQTYQRGTAASVPRTTTVAIDPRTGMPIGTGAGFASTLAGIDPKTVLIGGGILAVVALLAAKRRR